MIRSSTFTNCSSSDPEVMTIGSWAQFYLVSFTNGSTILTESSENESSFDDDDDICSWTTGAALTFSNDSFVLTEVLFINTSMVVLSINHYVNISLNQSNSTRTVITPTVTNHQ